jgi:hypothetical protein
MDRKQQQAELNKLSETLSKETAALWRDDFGAIDTTGWTEEEKLRAGYTSRPRPSHDFGGLVREEKHVVKPSAFTDADFAELAKRDPKFAEKWNEEQKARVTATFTQRNPDYIPTAKNYNAMCKYIRNNQLQDPMLDIDDVVDVAFEAGFWTVQNLETIFAELRRRGHLELPPQQAKALTKDEKIAVTATVRTGNLEAAIERYLSFALPGVSITSLEQLGREYPKLAHEISWFVFRESRPEISPDEFASFYASMRHIKLPTVATLATAWQTRYEQALLGGQRTITPAAPAPEPDTRELTEAELRDLPTEEIDKLITEQRKAYRRKIYNL